MSFAYAKRYGILCIDVSREELVIATMEPYDNSWVESLEQTSRRSIRRVIASPTDIKKYSLEFYSLANSVFGAGSSTATNAGISNFEQLLEVGKLKDADAALERATSKYKPLATSIDTTDGLGLEFDTWRFNLRKSNTEPVIRLNVESRGDIALMEEKTAELLSVIRDE